MIEPVTVSFESKCVCYLSIIYKVDGEISLRSSASGFFWRKDGIPYLITNRHCVTGKDHRNRLLPTATFEPTHLQIYFHEKGERIDPNTTMYRGKAIEVSLFKDGHPVWFEHTKGRLVDVVAIELDSPWPPSVDCINDRKVYDSWKLEAGADCLIVGFPEGLPGSDSTPIWKRASVASEPNLDYKGMPVFLCDSATRKGLSGGPVFGRALGMFDQNAKPIDPYSAGPKFFGYWPVFVGIYSGREGDENDGFQLGRVWKENALIDIVSNKTAAENPFVIHTE